MKVTFLDWFKHQTSSKPYWSPAIVIELLYEVSDDTLKEILIAFAWLLLNICSSTPLGLTSNSSLLEVKPSGVDEQIFNSNQAKAIKISSSVSSLTSDNNSITIAGVQYDLDDVWCY